jgi:hypothetical protein
LFAAVQALSPESPEPVVLVINADEPIVRRVALDALGSTTLHEIDRDYRDRPRAATAVLGVPGQEGASTILSFYFPDALTELDQPLPAGHFRVVVVDGGGITCRSRPIPKFRVGADGTLHIGRS